MVDEGKPTLPKSRRTARPCPRPVGLRRSTVYSEGILDRDRAVRRHEGERHRPHLGAGLVEVDETEIPCRSKNDPVTGGGGRSHQGKMLIVGAVEVQDGATAPRPHPPEQSVRLLGR